MNDRIDGYLDGTVDAAALTAAERAAAQAVESVIEDARAFVESRPVPDLETAVMRQIEQHRLRPARRAGMAARLAAMLWTPRPLSLQWRPAYALLGVAVIVAAASVMPAQGPPLPGARAGAVDRGSREVLVQFRLQAPDASEVRLAGSFTNWQPLHQLHEAAPGVWTLTVPLAPGVHDYVFVLDGEHWIPDPYAPQIDDGFGGTNSRIALLTPGDPRT